MYLALLTQRQESLDLALLHQSLSCLHGHSGFVLPALELEYLVIVPHTLLKKIVQTQDG